jgi:hypothetical protein
MSYSPFLFVCICICSQVYYLDSLDFGARLIDQSVPRISVWKGNMIKFFSELDHKKSNLFGKRHLKKNMHSCYSEVCVGYCYHFLCAHVISR